MTNACLVYDWQLNVRQYIVYSKRQRSNENNFDRLSVILYNGKRRLISAKVFLK